MLLYLPITYELSEVHEAEPSSCRNWLGEEEVRRQGLRGSVCLRHGACNKPQCTAKPLQRMPGWVNGDSYISENQIEEWRLVLLESFVTLQGDRRCHRSRGMAAPQPSPGARMAAHHRAASLVRFPSSTNLIPSLVWRPDPRIFSILFLLFVKLQCAWVGS